MTPTRESRPGERAASTDIIPNVPISLPDDTDGDAYLRRLAEYRDAAHRVLDSDLTTNQKVMAIVRLRERIYDEPRWRQGIQRELYEVVRDFLGCVQVDEPGTLLRDADAFLHRQETEQRMWLAAFASRLEGREDDYQATRFSLTLAEAHRVVAGGGDV